MYEWLEACNELPHFLVDAGKPGVNVPAEFVQDGKIVLNASANAVKNLYLGNEEIAFEARFGGQPMVVSFPPLAVVAIYGRESGEGMMFGPEDDIEDSAFEEDDDGLSETDMEVVESDPDKAPAESKGGKKKGPPDLKVIK